MQENVILGLSYAIIAGVFAGSFALPMKFTTQWKWQHNWIVYATWATLIMPIILALLTVPHLGSIYQSIDGLISLKVVLFGMAWGIGAIYKGLRVKLSGYRG